MRIYFCGAQSVGKTSLARLVAGRLGMKLLSEVVRQVLAEREPVGGLAALAGDLDEVTSFQDEVFRRQIAVEESAGDDYVSDRTFDNLVYSAMRSEPGRVAQLLAEPASAAYLGRVRAGRVFFVRPHRELLREDGTRSGVTWDGVLREDGAVLGLLAALGVPYVPVDCLEVADRLRVVMAVVGNKNEVAR